MVSALRHESNISCKLLREGRQLAGLLDADLERSVGGEPHLREEANLTEEES